MPGADELDEMAKGFDRVFESLSRVELQRGAGSLEALELADLFRPGEGLSSVSTLPMVFTTRLANTGF
jgi:hypothetical protein